MFKVGYFVRSVVNPDCLYIIDGADNKNIHVRAVFDGFRLVVDSEVYSYKISIAEAEKFLRVVWYPGM